MKKNLTFLFVLILFLSSNHFSISGATTNFSESKPNSPSESSVMDFARSNLLDTLEENFFKTRYSNETTTNRLARIESKLNISPEAGESVDSRIDKICRAFMQALSSNMQALSSKPITYKKDESKMLTQTSSPLPAITNWSDYVRILQRKVRINWSPPQNSRSQEARILLVLKKNGEVSHYKFIKGSNDPAYDQNCITAIKKASPFPPLPSFHKKDTINIDFTCSVKGYNEAE